MHFKLIVLFALVTVVRNHDVLIGSDGGRRIFEDTRFASPAIWRQVENVTVIAPNNEVISKVNITDMRADKDGDVDVVNGGEGEKSVTIEIKSPTVLRGYEFHIEVFSLPESNYKKPETSVNVDKAEDIPEVILNNEYKTTAVPQNSDSENSEASKEIPTSISKDSEVLRPARETNDEKSIPLSPEESETAESTETVYKESTTTENYLPTIDTEENGLTTESVEGSGIEENLTPAVPSDWSRPARGADSEINFPEMPEEDKATITTTETLNEVNTTIDDMSTPYDVDSQDSTTDVPEVLPIESDALRPARDTNNENESSETVNKDTTEDSLEANERDHTMRTPNTYVNSKNIGDYSALSILDYIKNKEQGNRQMRRTEDKLETSDTHSSSEEENKENDDASSPTGHNSAVESDDTVDLVPPEVDAPYNENFTPPLEITEEPIESSTPYTHSRVARRYEIYYDDDDSDLTTEAAMLNETTEGSTTSTTGETTTESLLEEKSRNSRNTEDNLENSDNLHLTSETGTGEPNIVENNKISSGIVLLKEDRVIITADGKDVQFTLPIVLIIGNENNFPVFKLVEAPADIEKKDLDEPESGLFDSQDGVSMDYETRDSDNNGNDFAKTDDY